MLFRESRKTKEEVGGGTGETGLRGEVQEGLPPPPPVSVGMPFQRRHLGRGADPGTWTDAVASSHFRRTHPGKKVLAD